MNRMMQRILKAEMHAPGSLAAFVRTANFVLGFLTGNVLLAFTVYVFYQWGFCTGLGWVFLGVPVAMAVITVIYEVILSLVNTAWKFLITRALKGFVESNGQAILEE